jgi:thiosulfate dehydrogenase (quinone) large subunit
MRLGLVHQMAPVDDAHSILGRPRISAFSAAAYGGLTLCDDASEFMTPDRTHAGDPRGAGVVSAVSPALALFPLRVFLGVTFVYAGIQKLSDPGYLHPGAPTYIGSQLNAFAHGTPGGFLLRAFALPAPKLAGVAVAFIEIVIGLLVLGGLLTRAAAAVGLGLNLVLFLTNSWHTSPYFLGSDIVFVFAWLPFVLAGASGQPAIDNSLDRLATARRRRPSPAVAAGRAARGRRPVTEENPALTRREVIAGALGATGALAVVLSAVSALAKGSYRSGATRLVARAPAPASTSTHSTSSVPNANPPATGPTTTTSAGGTLPSGAVRIGASTQLPRDQGATYSDPRDQQPDLIIRHSDGSLSAFSAICTHQGCQVGYQSGQIVCPCHGGLYNSRTGAVEGGPPPAPLPPRRVVEHAGSIYAVPS